MLRLVLHFARYRRAYRARIEVMNKRVLAPLIISGAPRSGTSLLYNLFDGHPDISWLGLEGYFFEYIHDIGTERAEILLDSAKCDFADFVDGLRDRDVIPPLHRDRVQSKSKGTVVEASFKIPWDEVAFRERLSSGKFTTLIDLWKLLAAAQLAALGQEERSFVCLKAADYAKSAVSALALSPAARAIIIVRNPINAIDSLKKSRDMRNEKRLTWPTFSLVISAYLDMHKRIRDLDESRTIVIRYEDLITNSSGVIADIADRLNIDFCESLLQPTFFGMTWEGFSSFAPTQGFDSTPANRTPQLLSRLEVDVIRKHLEEFLVRFDYP